MKKVTIILCSLIFLTGIISYSCKKESSTNNSQNKSYEKNNKNLGIERLFDAEYVQQLISISGIDPEKLSQSTVFIDYYANLNTINECFRTKFLSLLQIDDTTQANHYKNLLQDANNSIINGDTTTGLNIVNQVYTEIGCLSPTGFNYNGNNYNIPLDIEEFKLVSKSYDELVTSYPTLNKIDEQYKLDILTLAIYWHTGGKDTKSAGPTCSQTYSMACGAAIVGDAMCSELALGMLFPPAIACGEAACQSFFVYELYKAYTAYRKCTGH